MEIGIGVHVWLTTEGWTLMTAKPPHMPVKEALTIKVKITSSGEGQFCSFPGAHWLSAINLEFSVAVHSSSSYHMEEACQQ